MVLKTMSGVMQLVSLPQLLTPTGLGVAVAQQQRLLMPPLDDVFVGHDHGDCVASSV
jgi:hypothetical protein